MNLKLNKYILMLIWFIGWIITWPALLASLHPPRQDPVCNMAYNYRQNLGMSMFFAAFPPVWVVTPFLTGFYEEGFRFGRVYCKDLQWYKDLHYK